MRTGYGILRLVAPAAVLAGVGLLPACGGSTDPDGESGFEVTFSPLATRIPAVVGDSLVLEAAVVGATQARWDWTLDGEAVGHAATLPYLAVAAGQDTVSVTVSADGRTHGRTWVISVTAEPEVTPPPVEVLTVTDGAVPSEVVLGWRQLASTQHPVAAYLLAVSRAGPVTTLRWDEATPLWELAPRPEGAPMTATCGEADGLIPGEEVWFGIRVRDGAGRLSRATSSPAHTVTSPWRVRVELRDDLARPVAGAAVDFGDPAPALTGDDGTVDLGPFPDTRAVLLAVESPLFGVHPVPLTSARGDTTVRLALLNRHPPDHEPCRTADPGDFLALLRQATLTDQSSGRPTTLLKWERYPLAVWIPAARSPRLAWDLRELAERALAIWNDALGEDYFVAAADSAAADIELAFVSLSGLIGLTTVLDPPGGLGRAIPRRMRVSVEQDLDGAAEPRPQWVTEVALHELGHTLGFWGHLCGSSRGNLMDWGGNLGVLDGGTAAAIHEDECRVVRAVRHLPQGWDTAAWLAE